jgi:hypothetical protein
MDVYIDDRAPRPAQPAPVAEKESKK